MPAKHAAEAAKLFVEAHSALDSRSWSWELQQVDEAERLVGAKICEVAGDGTEERERAVLDLIERRVMHVYAYPSGYPGSQDKEAAKVRGPRYFFMQRLQQEVAQDSSDEE